MRHVRLPWFALSVLLLLATPALAQRRRRLAAIRRPPNSWTCSSTSPAATSLAILPASRPWARCSPRPSSPRRAGGGAPGPLVLVVGLRYLRLQLGQRRPARPATVSRRSRQRLLRADRDQPYRAGARLSGPDQGERRCPLEGAPRFVADACRAGARAQPARHGQLARSARPARLEHTQGADSQHGGLCLRPHT